MQLDTNDLGHFPVGYRRFHKRQVFNFQLNRWYSLGFLSLEIAQEMGTRVKNFDSWHTEMMRQAENAILQGDHLTAAICFRAAEFYYFGEEGEKDRLYDEFSSLFYDALEAEPLEKHVVPFANTSMHAIRIPRSDISPAKGTVVLHGGFDSYIEEFYFMMKFLSERGYEVIGFDGPGQGATLRKNGLAFDYHWERPVSAILDYFNAEDVTLIGLSMGGWLCLRAAAFETRVKRVISTGAAYDYRKVASAWAAWTMDFFSRHFPNWTNKMALKKVGKGGIEGWSIGQVMNITKMAKPMTAYDYMMQMNVENLHAEQIHQDVMLLTGRSDHFIPFRLHDKMVKELKSASSLVDRVFTPAGQAHNHCQIGNIGLAMDTMMEWMDSFK